MFFAGKMPGVNAFGGTYKRLTNKTANMLKTDLTDAGIPYVDSAERYADFHCLRHTTGSLLAASGVHPKIAQSIMRNSNINLTMSLYTYTLRGQESEAVKSLPDLSLPSSESQKASGTDNKAVETDSRAYKNFYFNGLSRSPFGTTSEQKNQNDGEVSTLDKSLQMTYLGTEKEHLSSGDINSKSIAPGRTRTCNLRIRSPRLYPIELRAPKTLSVCNITSCYAFCQFLKHSIQAKYANCVKFVSIVFRFAKILFNTLLA